MDHQPRPEQLFTLGNAQLDRGETEAAVATFQQCLALVPNNPGVLYNLGNALRRTGRSLQAIDAFVACLRVAPDLGAACVNLADTLRGLGMLTQAREMAELGVRHLPAEPAAIVCLANVPHDSTEYGSATTLYRQVLAAWPNHPGARTSLGNTLRALGQLDEAMEHHDLAVAAAPDDADIRYNRATTLLAKGDLGLGFAEYEHRWRRSQAPPRFSSPPWQGGDITGQTILLHAEQGLGDTLQFVRYAPMVAAKGATIILEVQPPLQRLIRQSMPFARVIARGDAVPPFDTHCPLLSLPHAFGTTLATIPAKTPYLHADPAAADAWKNTLPNDGLRVGLVWAGSPHDDDAGARLMDQRRSLRPVSLAPLTAIPGIQWVSLQQNQAPPAGLIACDPMPGITDFADTVALAANLDLVVSVDTSVAHLAAALGRPVWLLSRHNGCWRWLGSGDATRWYPTLKIYRQSAPLDWSDVIHRVRCDLTRDSV